MTDKVRTGLLSKMVGALEMPQDVFLDLPKITIIGGIQLHLANHQGVVSYKQDEIRIATSRGHVVVSGSGLKIASIFRSELVIDGKISSVQMAAGE